MTDKGQTRQAPPDARAQLAHLEKTVRAELKALSRGVEPLMDEVRSGVFALYPEPGGTRLAPLEQEAQAGKLLESLDGLEEVLEALQLAARSGRPAASGVGRGEE